MSAREVEQLRRKAAAAKSLLSRRYNEMNEALRNSSSTFTDYQQAAKTYKEQEEVFQAAVKAWKDAHKQSTTTGRR